MRKCSCSGSCAPRSDDYSRREFLELVGAGMAGALLVQRLNAEFAMPDRDYEAWRKRLFESDVPRVYLPEKHTDARMHLGGIGTGNIEIGADGQFTTWQLFNTLRDGYVPLYFAVKVGNVSRLLQRAGGPSWPRVQGIEMTGEYPVANLRFFDEGLPIDIELSAFSPFVPLDSRVSSMPLIALVFKLTNKGSEARKVSLAAFGQNPVGYDSRGEIKDNRHPALGFNFNAPLVMDSFAGLVLGAKEGKLPKIGDPVELFVGPNLAELNTPPNDRPDNLHVKVISADGSELSRCANPGRTIIWFEDAPAELPEQILRRARDAVRAGALLVFSGCHQPLLQAHGRFTQGRPITRVPSKPEILFEDFEKGYRNWQVEGSAFGTAPASGTLPNQQPVSGFLGNALVNTYLGGDDTVGKLTSRPFKIERNYIRFLVGGGAHPTTQIRLLVEGKVVRAASGRNNEKLEPFAWDVREFLGREAQIQIVDEQKGGWGHINVDHIVFSDDPVNRGTFELLEELLPIRFSDIRTESDGPDTGVLYVDFALQSDSSERSEADRGRLFVRAVGQGKVILFPGSILGPTDAGFVGPRQRAYEFLCSLLGVQYTRIDGQHPRSMGFGKLAIGVLTGKASRAEDVATAQRPCVTGLVSFDSWNAAWDRFRAEGEFDVLGNAKSSSCTTEGKTTSGAIAASVSVPGGGSIEVPFLLAWHFPNKYNASGTWMGCHYAVVWPDVESVIREALISWESICGKTQTFRRLFHSGALPWWICDCMSANAATIRHVGVVFRIANGDVYGWEGSNGCCQPTCTHVWGYEQSLARLFPDLEREMRRIDFEHQQRDDGGINNRTDVPSPPRPTGEHPFADGHASSILKAYREALNSPDEQFFIHYWPNVKRAVEYLIKRDAAAHNGKPEGYLEDDQWNTYDQALHGVTTFISGYYLAALRAGVEWARRVGDTSAADKWYEIFTLGQKNLVRLCWNGEYFQQHLPNYDKMPGEVGPGCMSDQLIGQWWAHQLGLGYILPREKVVSALRSIYRYNFKTDLTGWRHTPRAFAGDRDKGLIICTWPKGGRPPHVMLYSDEVWTGIEYQVAGHMIYEGLIEEGFAIARAARERYDGVPRPPMGRNPWNEIECGGHYARAMSSWSLLLALSGWYYDGPRQSLKIEPRYKPERFCSFWCATEGWGALAQVRDGPAQRNEFAVAHGALKLRKLSLPTMFTPVSVQIELGDSQPETAFKTVGGEVHLDFRNPVVIGTGQKLVVTLTR